jgi:hypothetical protein
VAKPQLNVELERLKIKANIAVALEKHRASILLD